MFYCYLLQLQGQYLKEVEQIPSTYIPIQIVVVTSEAISDFIQFFDRDIKFFGKTVRYKRLLNDPKSSNDDEEHDVLECDLFLAQVKVRGRKCRFVTVEYYIQEYR